MNRRHYEFKADGDWIMSVEDLMEQMEREREFQADLPVNDPKHWKMFKIDSRWEWLDIYWGGYEYSYELGRIETPSDLMWLVAHVSDKTWEHTTGYRIAALIKAVAQRKGWKRHG